MKSPLNILHLEENPDDAALVHATLETAGIRCAPTLVRNRDDFVAALKGGDVDLILSDPSLPTFDGAAAISVVRCGWPEIPVILVSSITGEEVAIDSLKSGATDYVHKDRLNRLAPAVRRAMREVAERAERRELETQFIEAQKMDVMGQLAGGVAHDFANILGVIIGYSDLIALDLGPGNPLQKYTDEIRLASERAAGLTRQLLLFSSHETVQPVVLDLNDVIREIARMLRRLIDENIELAIVPGDLLGRVKADPGYLGQVLMNLVVNARDAMPEGGTLTITTSNVTLADEHTHIVRGELSRDYVLLSARDTGTGMTEEVKKRLFEAFYTTKPKGKGTGLGLATCRTIVHQCGGHIEVATELGGGTEFKIYFPRAEQVLTAAVPSVPARPLPRGTETLLVVEDEPTVRHLARSILKAQGYEVLTAANGQEGLRVIRDHAGPPVSLVISDLIMPLMGGKVMAEWLNTTYPDLKILFTSGYTDDTIAHLGALDVGVEFLPKPYTPAGLLRKVGEMLSNGATPRFEVEKGTSRAR